MKLPLSRIEVMKYVGEKIDQLVDEFLNPIDSNWQPSDMLPDSTKDNFFDEVKLLQEAAKELPYDYWAVLIGDTITEEALPTYESWLMGMDTVNQQDQENRIRRPWQEQAKGNVPWWRTSVMLRPRPHANLPAHRRPNHRANRASRPKSGRVA